MHKIPTGYNVHVDTNEQMNKQINDINIQQKKLSTAYDGVRECLYMILNKTEMESKGFHQNEYFG